MNYGAFGARVSNTPEGAELMDVYFDPVVLKLVSILKRALPGAHRPHRSSLRRPMPLR